MLDVNAIISRYYSAANEIKVKDIEHWLINFDSLLKGVSPVDALKDKTFLCQTFYRYQMSGISRPHYQKVKEYLKNIFDYFEVSSTVPSREEVIESQEKICYFSDLDDALKFIDDVGFSKLDNYNVNIDLINIKSIIVLGWYGLSVDQIVALKTKEIRFSDDVYFIDSEDFEKVKINHKSYDILKTFASCDYQRGLPSGKISYYKGDNAYLFRPTKSDSQCVTRDNIDQALKRFNKCASFYKNALSFGKLRKNAKFIEIFYDTSDETLIQKIIRHMECNIESRMVYGYEKEYKRWLTLFHSNKI